MPFSPKGTPFSPKGTKEISVNPEIIPGHRLGSISLISSSLIQLSPSDYEGKINIFGIMPHVSKKMYIIQAESHQSMNEWMEIIASCSHKKKDKNSILEGYLLFLKRRQQTSEKWTDCYCVLSNRQIICYPKKKRIKNPLVNLELGVGTQILVEETYTQCHKHMYSFTIHSRIDEPITLCAFGDQDFRRWINALSTLIPECQPLYLIKQLNAIKARSKQMKLINDIMKSPKRQKKL